MYNIYNYSREKLAKILIENYKQKIFCVSQLFIWIYVKKIFSFDNMLNISKKFRIILKKDFYIDKPKLYSKLISKDGTIKFLIKLHDDNIIEAVIMHYKYGYVLCISSQVGCNFACSFCTSGLFKKKRNLDVFEMVGEILIANEILQEKNEKISRVVIMGIGEPFDNYNNVIDFIKILNDQNAFSIGARHITISTCGLVDKIMIFAKEKIKANLAVSLHASNNKKRNKIMPINYHYSLKQLINAVKFYIANTKKRVTFEYILLMNVNDSFEDAKQLANLIKGLFINVNLILYNETYNNNYKRSTNIDNFFNWLKQMNVNVQIRKEFGSDIFAACGQLKLNFCKKND